MATWGFTQGLIVGALSCAGFGGGALLGSRLGPILLTDGSHSPYAPLFALIGGLLAGAVLASMLEIFGVRLRAKLGDALGLLDGLAGAVLMGCVAVALIWIASASALQASGAGQLRRDIQRSRILQVVNEKLPPSGSVLRALARFDPFPRIAGPAPNVRAPDSRIARDADVQAASRSVVRVLGTACGLGIAGSGWVAADGVVVTNAHVIAGQRDTTVQLRGEGPRHRAVAVWFDNRNDLAILRSDRIRGAPPLSLRARAAPGTAAAVIGFPANGPLDLRPARVGATTTVSSSDAYGDGPVQRRVTTFRGHVRPGNSGGPVVDRRGRVLTTVFAAILSERPRGGLGVPDTIVRDALRRTRGPADTGPCAR